MEIHKKLEHLSEQQIEEVIIKYSDKSVKLIDVIEEYKIDVKPAGLLKILPPIITGETCIYCGQDLYMEREGRTSYCYSDTKFCGNCGHKVFSEIWADIHKCNCKNCIAYQKQIVIEKQNKIRNLYGVEQLKIKFCDMDFKNQVNLLYILRNNPRHSLYEIQPPNFYEENKKQWIKKVNSLLEIKAISISPKNKITVFREEDFPHIVCTESATFNVNIEFENKILKQINDNVYFKESAKLDEKLEEFKEYIYIDAINKFEELLQERNLELHISEEANKKFIELIDKISYTQLNCLCFQNAKYFSDQVITGRMAWKHACNAALINVSKFYENAIINNRTINHSSHEYAGKELRFYVEKVLGKKLSLLKEVASLDAIVNAEIIDKDYNKDIIRF